MNARYILLTLILVALAAAGGWYAAHHSHSETPGGNSAGAKVLYYQSPMHPWIKSDKPGHCTICGMKLVPVLEGEKGFATGADITSLGSNIINVINVQTEEVRKRPLVRTLRVAGRIEDNDARHRFVSAYVDGRIDKLAINYIGALVVEGEPLATFYSPALLTAEHEYLALLRQSQFTNIALRADQKNLITAAAYRLKRLGLTDSQIKELEQKQEAETEREIRSPMSGTVVQRYVYEGQYVKEGDKLFELADFSTMWFQFDAYERDLAWIRAGQMVDVITPAVPGKVFSAPVAFIDPNINEMTRTARVRVEIQNPLLEENGRKRRELYHRLYAEGLVKAEVPPVLALPRSAVISPGPQAVAYVDQGAGSYEQRRLKLGRLGDDLWEVLEGVAEGEKVVTSGNMLIDAQAQLNQSAHPSEASTPTEPTNQTTITTHEPSPAEARSPVKSSSDEAVEKLTESQQRAARDFLVTVDAVAQALASDNLAQFNQEAQKLHTALPALTQALGDIPSWQPLIQKLDSTGHLPSVADLSAARKAFFPFSTAAVEWAKKLRAQEKEFASLKIYQCPMANTAFPGAPRKAFWVQIKEPLQNPFFGAQMLTCGSEVMP